MWRRVIELSHERWHAQIKSWNTYTHLARRPLNVQLKRPKQQNKSCRYRLEDQARLFDWPAKRWFQSSRFFAIMVLGAVAGDYWMIVGWYYCKKSSHEEETPWSEVVARALAVLVSDADQYQAKASLAQERCRPQTFRSNSLVIATSTCTVIGPEHTISGAR